MGLAEAKNDIKIVFLILNTICAFAAGVYLVASGVSYAVVTDNTAVTVAVLVVGLLLLGLAVLGYVGAIQDHRVVLIVYSVVLLLFLVIDVAALSVWAAGDLALYSRTSYRHPQQMTMIQPMTMSLSHAGISLASVSLAAVLASQARRQVNPRNQGCVLSPPRPTGPLLSG